MKSDGSVSARSRGFSLLY